MAALRRLCLLLSIVAMGSQSKVGIGQTGPESALVAGDLDPVDRTCEEGVQCKRQSECKSFNEALEEYKEMPTGTCKKKAKFAELKHSVCNKVELGVCCRDSYSCLQNFFHTSQGYHIHHKIFSRIFSLIYFSSIVDRHNFVFQLE